MVFSARDVVWLDVAVDREGARGIPVPTEKWGRFINFVIENDLFPVVRAHGAYRKEDAEKIVKWLKENDCVEETR